MENLCDADPDLWSAEGDATPPHDIHDETFDVQWSAKECLDQTGAESWLESLRNVNVSDTDQKIGFSSPTGMALNVVHEPRSQ